MKERPIIFSSEMVRAILGGRKTMTRRTKGLKEINKHPDHWSLEGYDGEYAKLRHHISDCWMDLKCPYGVPGDRLWVRETWCPFDEPEHFLDPSQPKDALIYGRKNGAAFRADPLDADAERCRIELGYKWRPSVFMPRWASRITLEITGVRVERLQEITEADAIREGVTGPFNVGYRAFRLPGDSKPRYSTAEAAFEALWDFINGKTSPWESNPWVWCISFERVS